MGDEARGLVIVDFDGHPQKYDEMQIMSDIVAKETGHGQYIALFDVFTILEFSVVVQPIVHHPD